jgi:hypothetical protein
MNHDDPKSRRLRGALSALVILAGAALCFTLATLALREVSYTRGLQALLAAAVAAGLVRLIQGPHRHHDELDEGKGSTLH